MIHVRYLMMSTECSSVSICQPACRHRGEQRARRHARAWSIMIVSTKFMIEITEEPRPRTEDSCPRPFHSTSRRNVLSPPPVGGHGVEFMRVGITGRHMWEIV